MVDTVTAATVSLKVSDVSKPRLEVPAATTVTNTVTRMIRRRMHRRKQAPIKAKKEVVKRVTKSDRRALNRKLNLVERIIMDENMKPHSKNKMSALDEVRALFHSKYG